MDQTVLYKLPYGLFVLTSGAGGRESGCIINTAVQVTSEPNRISIAVNQSNFTHDLVKESGRFNLSILSESAGFDLFQHFGFQSGRETDKFAGYGACRRSANGLYYITAGTNGFLSGTVEQVLNLGTHTLFLAGVDAMEPLSDAPSVTYAYYQSHIKPQPRAAAPSAGKTVWQCKVCGYIYEGEELPEDFICPLCKHPASDFEKVAV